MPCCDTSNLMSIENAITKIRDLAESDKKVEKLALSQSLHRITASDIFSPINVPSFANSAMDGYAVRLSDLEQSMTLTIAGKSMAGKPFEGVWPAGSCIRIMTGAVIPEGANAVIMQENARVQNDMVSFQTKPKLNENIRPIGDDVALGEKVLDKGTLLSVREMPLLASLGIEHIDVIEKVKVAFFSTGDELRQVGEKLNQGEIYDSNRYTIQHWLEQMHCHPIDLGVIPDDKAALKAAFLQAATQADLIITSGGVSVGDADFTKEILAEEGEVNFWKLAIKPGKPFAFGKIYNTLFCGLPGNPVSALVTMHVLVQPLLAKLSGHLAWQPSIKIPAVAETAFKKRSGRTDYQRAIYSVNEKAQLVVSGIVNQGSGAFSGMSKANCFVVLEQDRGPVSVGETVMVEPFDAKLS